MFKICTLCSSSKGNCSFITDGETNILVDCGIKATNLIKFLSSQNLTISDIDAIVITHEHIDHICGLRSVCKKITPVIYAHNLIKQPINERLGTNIEFLDVDMNGFMVGNIKVLPFRTSHDSLYSLGYNFVENGTMVSVATDLGFVSNEVKENLMESSGIIIEANHDRQMLIQGDYPMLLKRRVDGISGHLSNDASADLICELGKHKLRKVILAHLSENNNLPELAYSTVTNKIKRNHLEIEVEVAPTHECSRFLEV